jgi:dinuclear metal center YbgI/SA1388 family protein
MAKLQEIEQFLNSYLEIEAYQADSVINGLNVSGKERVEKIVVGVSPNMELFKKADKWAADLIITHHALFNKGMLKDGLRGIIKNRINFLLSRNISLFCYHLPLDFHKEIGNNVLILEKLGANFKKQAGEFEGFKGIFFVGQFSKSISRDVLIKKIKRIFQQEIKTVLSGKKAIKTIAVVSGAGTKLVGQLPKEVDLYLTGEITESVPSLVKEMKMNFVAAGHYATEVFGIQALAKRLEKKFRVKTKFIPVRVSY